MTPCELTMGITALANAVAAKLSDEDLGVVAGAYTQLGDTLNTILVQRMRNRVLCEKTSGAQPDAEGNRDGG